MSQACATRIVVDHFHKGQLPLNPFPLDSLSLDAHKVSFEELRQILNLVHLIRCIEDFCLYNTEWGRDCYFHLKQENKAAPPQENWLKWPERFHRSMYQSFLMGAVLCRAYQQPLDPSNNWTEPVLTNDEMACLLRYPVFNFEAYKDHEPIYGQLADFLVQQSWHRAQSRSTFPDFYPEDAIPNNLDRGQASLLYTQTVQCLLASMTLLNHEGYSPIFEKDNKNPDIKSLSRKIAMPTSVQAAHQTRLLKSPLPQETGEPSWNPSARFMSLFLDIMHSSSGQPNHYADTFPTPPPLLQIFQFISQEFLGLRFSDEAFDVEDIDAAHKLFVHHPTASGIYEDEWPILIPSIFDTPDGGGEYDAYYLV
ncbi:hypothetical protein BDV09DRAFT_204077 [Aspergillus tetrazonus]